MPLMDDVWGQVGVVVKRGFGSDGKPAVTALRLADVMADTRILAEAEMALFKTSVDFHLQGLGNAVDAAAISVDAVEVLTYAKLAVDPLADPDNLFGYEPRDARISLNTTGSDFDLATQGPDLFRSTRRTKGYLPKPFAGLSTGAVHLVATSRIEATTTTRADLTVTLKTLTLHVWLYEGGPDRDDYWCAHAQTTLVADTVTLTPVGAEVLWRGAVPLTAAPLALIRKLEIREGA